jgi:hypothetical protein
MFVRESCSLEATLTSMVPIPTAWIKLLLNPFTINGGIALSHLKSPHLGEMWQFTPESRMNRMDPTLEMGGSWLSCSMMLLLLSQFF